MKSSRTEKIQTLQAGNDQLWARMAEYRDEFRGILKGQLETERDRKVALMCTNMVLSEVLLRRVEIDVLSVTPDVVGL